MKSVKQKYWRQLQVKRTVKVQTVLYTLLDASNNFIMRFLCKWIVCPWINLSPDNKDEIRHTSNIRKVSIGTVDLLHVTGIKGDKIMEVFSRLNSASSIELIWMIWMNNSRNCPGKATNPIQTTRSSIERLSVDFRYPESLYERRSFFLLCRDKCNLLSPYY